MHVLHLSTALTWRGGEQQIAYLHKGLQAAGIKQSILCPTKSALYRFCNTYSLPCAHVVKTSSISWAYAKKIKELVQQHNIDLIHIHDSHAHSNAVLAATLFGLTTPMILHRRVDFAVSNNLFSRYKYNHPNIKRIISVSKAIENILSPAIKDQSKLRVIYSGVDTNKEVMTDGRLRKSLGLPVEALLIGNVAALADHKDPYTFLKVAEALKDQPQYYFVWIGAGEMEAEMRTEIAKRNLQGRVFLTGFRNDVRDILPELWIFLMTSKTEGLGTSILDAYLATVPVVATAAGGIPELVEHGHTGLLAPVGDADMLAMHILHLTLDKEYSQNLTTAAKQKAIGFDYHIMAGQVLEVYREVLGK
ncbi:glycosyltransferase [soil metagenome]